VSDEPLQYLVLQPRILRLQSALKLASHQQDRIGTRRARCVELRRRQLCDAIGERDCRDQRQMIANPHTAVSPPVAGKPRQ